MASARSRRSVASDLMPVAEEDGMQQVDAATATLRHLVRVLRFFLWW